ncbi:OLC1v1002550C1 [Oldenlandia corymbosa var. corymbosa]|uniref:OLC1v1002550C1 n=1 Tax=Oldenlandia corymbosa var. corymbosa TaxID=529605 RepID=A0AAV1D7W4_OLDCO|nr:OLC1v1002550C1 [Oldenlandia corymbosa var. corymbosa]
MSCNSTASPPSPPPITPPSKKRLLANPKPVQGPQDETPNLEPFKDKITRDLPNLSECHGCGLRIDFSNPKARLQPLDSFWRIVLLCKRCFKQVNSGHACLYCFKDTMYSESDCLSCADCERLVHKDCVKKFGESPPWSYSCRGSSELGLELGFSVCIDCWLPELLKSSIRVSRKYKNDNGVAVNCDIGEKSFEEMMKEANYDVKDKIAFAEKAKEKALRKAVAAQNAVKLANGALHLADRKDLCDSANEGDGANDDTGLAFQLHRAMNSSPRISKNTRSVNRSRSHLYQKGGSKISAKWMGLSRSEDGLVAVGNNSELDHDGSILEASGDVSCQGTRSKVVSGRLKSVMMTYNRCNLKRYYSETVEESYFQNACNPRFARKNGQLPPPKQSNPKVKGEGSGDADSDKYFMKFTKKMKGSSQVSHKKTSSRITSPVNEIKQVVLCLPAVRAIERSGSCDASLRSYVGNLR